MVIVKNGIYYEVVTSKVRGIIYNISVELSKEAGRLSNV